MGGAPALLAGGLLLIAQSLQADPIQLGLPIDCSLGTTCHISDYVDHSAQAGKQVDHACNFNSRDGHKGTDFALISYDAYENGVKVFAAAPGVVRAIRDEMPDDRLMPGVTNQNACGNAVVINHKDGWQSWYCHLKLGSVSVKPGEKVDQGQTLGLVGLSGQPNHPHLHFQLHHQQALTDPFQPGPLGQCQEDTAPLWQDPIGYTPTGLLTAGFSDHVPTLAAAYNGSALIKTAAPNVPMVLYMTAAFAQTGDVLRFLTTGPSGTVFDHELVLENPKKHQMQAFGRNAPNDGWPTGEYLGEVYLMRQGTIIDHRFNHLRIEKP